MVSFFTHNSKNGSGAALPTTYDAFALSVVRYYSITSL